MTAYSKYATTVVGSYSVPRWYDSLEKEVEAGKLPRADMADAQCRCTQAAVKDQEVAGIDILTGGEMHRRTNNRHAPPNAMLNFFWEKLPVFAKETRPKPITKKDPNVSHPAAVCVSSIGYADLGLVEEFRTVSSQTDRDVKVTMTGPHMLAKVAFDEHYGDIGKMMQDLAKVLNRNFRGLETAGCRYVQIDEPLFAVSDDAEVEAAVEAINLAVEGLKKTSVQVLVCHGNYAVGEEYDGQMGNKRLAVGAADVQDPNVEAPEVIAERITRLRWLTPEQTLITSSCGMNHLRRGIAFGKLKAMTEAKRILLAKEAKSAA